METVQRKFKGMPSFDPDSLNDEPEFPDYEDDIPDDEDYDEEEIFDDGTDDEDEPEDATPEEIKILDFDDILDADDTAEVTLFVPEWKGSVVYKGITKAEFDHMRRVSRSPKNKGRSNSVLEREILIAGMVKPEIDIARYNRLQEKSSGVILRLTNKILEKSGLAEDAETRREKRFPRK